MISFVKDDESTLELSSPELGETKVGTEEVIYGVTRAGSLKTTLISNLNGENISLTFRLSSLKKEEMKTFMTEEYYTYIDYNENSFVFQMVGSLDISSSTREKWEVTLEGIIYEE